MEEYITTTEAALLAGVGVSSIKRWSDQDLIQVVRTPGGHRRVNRADLLRFLDESSSSPVSTALARESSLPSKPRDLRSALSISRIGLIKKLAGPEIHLAPENPDDPKSAGVFWANAMRDSDVFELQALLLHARSRRGSWHATADEAAHGLSEVGERWMRGEMSVMDEHIASERLARALSAIMETMPGAEEEPVCMLACVTGDMHTLGLSFLQLCVRERGWRPLWVGASTPLEELYAVAAAGEVAMIAISASEASSDTVELAEFAQMLGAACAASGTSLAFGGSGAWPDPPLFGMRFYAFGPFSAYLQSQS
ncbi:MAG: helix-turn-helix domain-containing protein [Rhodothermales bacterium]|nr:helix-turn-helix domain-containing protein [Rhodothermales bacterium]MBO6778600.1 helix-turn-helix domain-containing protein [Rhodothermales bacterium]